MTEQEWLASVDLSAMLAHVQGKVSDRKLRLLACACVRQVWELLTDDAPCPRCREWACCTRRPTAPTATTTEWEPHRVGSIARAMPSKSPKDLPMGRQQRKNCIKLVLLHTKFVQS